MVWMAVVRSPYAHARITSVDLTAAREAEGVVAAFSGADLADQWAGGLPCAWPVTEDIKLATHWPLAVDKARYAGDGVAVVIADSRALAKDAAELVQVDYEPLPAVSDVEAALGDDAPILHDDLGTNHCYTWKLEAGETERLFAEAAVTVKERYYQNRLIPNAIEPRGVIVQPVPTQGEYTMWSATQIPHILRTTLTLVTGIPEAKLRVIAPDVGGGFGSKLNVYAEEALCLALARKLGRPIKWIEERSEAYVATIHGRDVVQEIELAATADGTITAVRVRLTAAMGAYLQLVTPGIPILGAWLYGGATASRATTSSASASTRTRRRPTPIAGPADPRRRTRSSGRSTRSPASSTSTRSSCGGRTSSREFPATIAAGLTIDSGDYDASLDKALAIVDYEAVRAEQAERRERGDPKQLGIGFSTYVEMCGLAPSRILGAIRYVAGGWDAATIRFLPTGTVQAIIGTSPHGQGHVTTFSQLVADRFGVPLESVEVIHGDTMVSPLGMDTYGSRSLTVGGVSLWQAADKVVAKAKEIVAHQFEVDVADLQETDGTFTRRGHGQDDDRGEAAFAAWTAHDLPDGMEPGLEATAVYDPANFSWPGGTHIAVVEVDTETGSVDLRRYVAVDDLGVVVNPTIVDGQVAGGIAQGVAQALFEEAVYDDEANLLTSNMVTYMVPSAAELPTFEIDRTETRATDNPLGVKGVGETGAIASPPAVMNALVDALSPFGIYDIAMPATPERVWRALEEAR